MTACKTTITPSGSLFSILIIHVPVDHSKGRSALLLVLYLLCSHRQTLSIITRGNQLFSRICNYVIRPDIPAVIYLVLVQTLSVMTSSDHHSGQKVPTRFDLIMSLSITTTSDRRSNRRPLICLIQPCPLPDRRPLVRSNHARG